MAILPDGATSSRVSANRPMTFAELVARANRNPPDKQESTVSAPTTVSPNGLELSSANMPPHNLRLSRRTERTDAEGEELLAELIRARSARGSRKRIVRPARRPGRQDHLR